MLSTQSLRDQLDIYASGSITSDQLEEWIASESWDMRRWAPRGLQQLIEAVQGVFIDYSDGKLSADDLRQYLMRRREQLHNAERVTQLIRREITLTASIQSVGVNEGVTVQPEPEPVVA